MDRAIRGLLSVGCTTHVHKCVVPSAGLKTVYVCMHIFQRCYLTVYACMHVFQRG